MAKEVLDDPDAIIRECDPVIRGIIRRKLRVSLDDGDGRRDNQDALEVHANLLLLLAGKLSSDGAGASVRDIKSYMAVASYHACSQYLRDKYPNRRSLINRLRYFLDHSSGYAVWESETGELLCGLFSWTNRSAPGSAADRLIDSPVEELGGSFPPKQLNAMRGEDWGELLHLILGQLGAPVELNDLARIIAGLLGVRDELEVSGRPDSADEDASAADPIVALPASGADPLDQTLFKEFLSGLWREISDLGAAHRLAYLLNFRDGDLHLFPFHGVASIVDIGRTLALSEEQFSRTWPELPLEETDVSLSRTDDYDVRFGLLWCWLPLEDAVIAKMLGCERQKVINLRQKARERVSRRIRTALA